MGAYAVQLARQASLRVFATAASRDVEYVRGLGAATVVNYETERFEDVMTRVDIVIDTVGRDTRDRSYGVLKPGGILVSVVTPFPETQPQCAVRTAFFIVEGNDGSAEYDRGAVSSRLAGATGGYRAPLREGWGCA